MLATTIVVTCRKKTVDLLLHQQFDHMILVVLEDEIHVFPPC